MKKEELRELFRKKRDSLSDESRELLNRKMLEKLWQWQIFIDAEIVMSFVSFRSEIDTHNIIKYCLKENKKIAIPKVGKRESNLQPYLIKKFPDDLEIGAYGILEPHPDKCKSVNIDDINLIFVPGLVFDRFGFRVGYGKGYFDNFLKKVSQETVTCGLCYSFQLVEKINHQKWDKPVDFIMSDEGLIECRGED